jgi:hypothetical protein
MPSPDSDAIPPVADADKKSMKSSSPLEAVFRGIGIVASVAVVLLAVAVVVPGEDPSMRSARLRRVVADIGFIGNAFTDWARSGDSAVVAKLGAEPDVWYGTGALPKSTLVRDGVRWPLHDVLVAGASPRVDHVPTDPWGNAYVILRVDGSSWKILSAGPDGVLETSPSAIEDYVGDDVGGRLVR